MSCRASQWGYPSSRQASAICTTVLGRWSRRIAHNRSNRFWIWSSSVLGDRSMASAVSKISHRILATAPSTTLPSGLDPLPSCAPDHHRLSSKLGYRPSRNPVTFRARLSTAASRNAAQPSLKANSGSVTISSRWTSRYSPRGIAWKS